MRHRIPVVAILPLVILTGCLSTQPARQKSPTPSPAAQAPAGATVPPNVMAVLTRYVLTLPDLPSGYELGVQRPVSNSEAIGGYADPQAALKEVQSTGRQGGIAQQVISTTPGSSPMGVSIEIFAANSGAQQWLLHPPALPPILQTTATDLPQQLGEQSTALHFTESKNNLAGYIVSFRRGRVVFGLGVSAPAGKESLESLLAIGKQLDDKAQKQST